MWCGMPHAFQGRTNPQGANLYSQADPYRAANQSSFISAIRHARASADAQELRICTNKTCKKQGSVQVAKFAEDLGLKGLQIERTGCLGKCGNGPNMVLLPLDVLLSHINTTAKMTEALRSVGGYSIPDSLLKATELRLAGNAEARSGRLREAAELYGQALAHNPPYGRHMLLSNRSGVLLGLGQADQAARDAAEAVDLAPPGFTIAYIRQVEALLDLGDREAAVLALEAGASRDPAFMRSAEYKQFCRQLGQ